MPENAQGRVERGERMASLLIVFSESLNEDLEKRPGLSKLSKRRSAIPRAALRDILTRMSRDFEKETVGPGHLRADHLDEPLETRLLYCPNSLAGLLGNYAERAEIPEKSRFFRDQPHGYIARFHYRAPGLSVLTAYLEMPKPALVFIHAGPEGDLKGEMKKARNASRSFDKLFQAAHDAASDAG